jgi:hypothetical protein
VAEAVVLPRKSLKLRDFAQSMRLARFLPW